MNKTLTLIIRPLGVLQKRAVYKGNNSVLQTTYNIYKFIHIGLI